LRTSVNDSINKALLDKDGDVKFLDTLSQMMVTNLEPLVTKELSTRLGATVEKSLGAMVGKMEERLQTSIEKSLQRIQKENRTSHHDMTKKLDALTQNLANITQQLKDNEAKSVSRVNSPVSTTPSTVSRLQQKMADQFKAGDYSDGIETVFSPLIHGIDI
jgi:ubiquinone biosynthesis protein UbiJ